MLAGLVPEIVDRLTRKYPQIYCRVTQVATLLHHYEGLLEREVDVLIGRVPQPQDAANDSTDRRSPVQRAHSGGGPGSTAAGCAAAASIWLNWSMSPGYFRHPILWSDVYWWICSERVDCRFEEPRVYPAPQGRLRSRRREQRQLLYLLRPGYLHLHQDACRFPFHGNRHERLIGRHALSALRPHHRHTRRCARTSHGLVAALPQRLVGRLRLLCDDGGRRSVFTLDAGDGRLGVAGCRCRRSRSRSGRSAVRQHDRRVRWRRSLSLRHGRKRPQHDQNKKQRGWSHVESTTEPPVGRPVSRVPPA